MKWVWTTWSFSKRSSINWVIDLIFVWSFRSFCREIPWKVRRDCLVCLITYIYLEVAATCELTNSKDDHQEKKWESRIWNPHGFDEENAAEEVIYSRKFEADSWNIGVYVLYRQRGRERCEVLWDQSSCGEHTAKTVSTTKLNKKIYFLYFFHFILSIFISCFYFILKH